MPAIDEHWLIEQDEEHTDEWSVCRYSGRWLVGAWGDKEWTMTTGAALVRVHVICNDYTASRPDIRDLIHAMLIMEERNQWVTYRRVTVDFRE